MPSPKGRPQHPDQDKTRAERVQRARRANEPLTIGKDVRFLEVRIFGKDELRLLNVDERYQRLEIKDEVDSIIRALASGGQVIGAIKVAMRKDGSLWIVDGQQRYWAHWHLGLPIRAEIYAVESLDAERRMFSVEQTHRRPMAGVRVRAWVGGGAELIRWLHESPDSPIRSDVSWTGSGRYSAVTLTRGLVAALGGFRNAGGSIEKTVATLDTLVRDVGPTVARRVATFYALALKQIFGDHGKALSLPSIAIGLACHDHWAKGWQVTGLPRRAVYQLSHVRWERYAPTSGLQWLDGLHKLVLRQWPIRNVA